ncbi:MAG TPA: cytochrome C oxidase subunit IV family protein [Tepidisphaeraceae bacterium]|nr:cytochrome C oxidase subunit IV family protein [Tepidisphaeraceae bacterium]
MSEEAHDHIVSPVAYVGVLLALLALLVLTVALAFIDLDGRFHTHYVNLAVAILIAMTKAFLIILIFMHVKYGSKLTWAFASAAFVWLGIMMTLSLTDYLSRDYREGLPTTAPQAGPNIIRTPERHQSASPGASAQPVRPPVAGRDWTIVVPPRNA